MAEARETLRYHGRRSVDELIGALNADSFVVALVHKELSLLHLDRFVTVMRRMADDIHYDTPSPSDHDGRG